MKPIFALLLLAALSAHAQDKAPSPAMVQGFTAALERQRNEALNTVAAREGQLAEAAEQLKALKEEVERLKKACGKPCDSEKK